MTARIFVIDDLAESREMVRRLLDPSRFQVEVFDSVLACLAAVEGTEPDLIVTDVRMPGLDGVEGVRRFHETVPDVPVIVMTAYASIEDAIQAMKHGAFDYLKKPFQPSEMEAAIERALRHRALARENRALRTRVSDMTGRQVIAYSRAMRDVLDLVGRVAPTDATILIEGESGTGKEVVAREVHARGRRAEGPFLAVNCAAIPETLLEGEIFGHERGAFTGADRAKKGLFAEAGGGTILLDEIGEMPLVVQPKLLRVLDSGEFFPLGSSTPRQADVRIVCATNRDLAAMVRDGRFREDLYYRIHVVTIRVPPLRDRPEDVEPLARYFARRHAARLGLAAPPVLSPTLLSRLRAHPWPGNVRELENAVERAILVSDGAALDAPTVTPTAPTAPSDYQSARQAFEQAYFAGLLAAVDGNVARAAEVARLHRSTLYEKLARLGIPT